MLFSVVQPFSATEAEVYFRSLRLIFRWDANLFFKDQDFLRYRCVLSVDGNYYVFSDKVTKAVHVFHSGIVSENLKKLSATLALKPTANRITGFVSVEGQYCIMDTDTFACLKRDFEIMHGSGSEAKSCYTLHYGEARGPVSVKTATLHTTSKPTVDVAGIASPLVGVMSVTIDAMSIPVTLLYIANAIRSTNTTCQWYGYDLTCCGDDVHVRRVSNTSVPIIL